MKNRTYSILIYLLIITIVSCKKNNTGGNATIVAFPEHHGKPIYGATVYVKFNAIDLPSNPTNNYNLKIDGGVTENSVYIKGLRYGSYYLYSVGYDSSIHMPVSGGIAVKVKWKERKQELDIKVPVTE